MAAAAAGVRTIQVSEAVSPSLAQNRYWDSQVVDERRGLGKYLFKPSWQLPAQS